MQPQKVASANEQLAPTGGTPARVLRGGRWNRGPYAERFEETWAKMLSAKHCLVLANGTSAFIHSIERPRSPSGRRGNRAALYIRGDHSVRFYFSTRCRCSSIPTSRRSRSTRERSKLPSCPGRDAFYRCTSAVSRHVTHKHRIPTIEDACRAHLAEWRKRPPVHPGSLAHTNDVTRLPVRHGRNCGSDPQNTRNRSTMTKILKNLLPRIPRCAHNLPGTGPPVA